MIVPFTASCPLLQPKTLMLIVLVVSCSDETFFLLLSNFFCLQVHLSFFPAIFNLLLSLCSWNFHCCTFQPQNFAWFFFYNLYSLFWLFLKEHSCVDFEAHFVGVALRLHSRLSGQQPGSSAHTFQRRLLCSADGSV